MQRTESPYSDTVYNLSCLFNEVYDPERQGTQQGAEGPPGTRAYTLSETPGMGHGMEDNTPEMIAGGDVTAHCDLLPLLNTVHRHCPRDQ